MGGTSIGIANGFASFFGLDRLDKLINQYVN